jgi:hypothetical protein
MRKEGQGARVFNHRRDPPSYIRIGLNILQYIFCRRRQQAGGYKIANEASLYTSHASGPEGTKSYP